MNVPQNKPLMPLSATAAALLNATSDLNGIIDTKGKILSLSGATAYRLKKDAATLIGKNIFDYFSGHSGALGKAYVEGVVASGQPMRFEDHYLDHTLLVCLYPVLNKEQKVVQLVVSVADYTQLNRKENLRHRYSQILSSILDPIVYIDRDLHFGTVNDAALEILGTRRRNTIGHPLEAVLSENVLSKHFKVHVIQALSGQTVSVRDWYTFVPGRRRFMHLSFSPLYAKQNAITGVVVNMVDVTQMKELEEKLKLKSETDHLTGIFNRIKFHQTLEEELVRVDRYNVELSLIMFDIDHFKQVNDTHGHDVGDEVLVTMCKLIKNNIRTTDIFSRWGGEEFMILAQHTGLGSAAHLAELLRVRVEEHTFRTVGNVTASFGVTQFATGDTIENFTKRVDMALYKSKEMGRNQVVAIRATALSLGRSDS